MSKGQYFTKNSKLQKKVFDLCKNKGKSLEPSAGVGFLSKYFKDNARPIDLSIEIDNSLKLIDEQIIFMDFFDYSVKNKFNTIVGNPPYVKYQEIEKLSNIKSSYSSLNLYLYFIEKCFYHLENNGEIVFIIPRDFLTSTRAKNIRKLLFENGTITHIIDYQEEKLFNDADPYVIIIRYEKDNHSHITSYEINGKSKEKEEIFSNGFLKYINKKGFLLKNYFDIKVGMVSGANSIFQNDELGTIDIICSDYITTGKKKKYIFDENNNYSNEVWDYLKQNKTALTNRKIRNFNENNWFEWGAVRNLSYMKKIGKVIYVNNKTRNEKPFFVNDLGYFDGAVLCLIPKTEEVEKDIYSWCDILNNSKERFLEQGFLVGNKYQFTQNSLENLYV